MLIEQLIGVGIMTIVGLGGGLLYDGFRAVRQVRGWKKWGTLFSVVLYSLLLVSIFVLTLLAVNDGQLRSYVYLGLLLGYVVYFGLLHRFFWKPLVGVISMLHWLLVHGWRIFCWPFGIIKRLILWPVEQIQQKWVLKRQLAAEGMEEDLE